jgi:hypothetical protein
MNLLDETNPHTLQIRLAQMMANMAASSSSPGHHMDTMMSTIANMQRNILLKIFNDPMAAAQATAAAVSATQMKSNISPIALITSNNKQIGSGRKRKSTPEKRVITNHRSTNNNNNGDVEYFLSSAKISQIFFLQASPTTEHNSADDITDHPLELTVKDSQRSNRVVNIQNSFLFFFTTLIERRNIRRMRFK